MEPLSYQDKDQLWHLMRRDDLATVIGVVFRIPFHGVDESGNLRYGLAPMGGARDPDVSAEFQAEMRQIVRESALPLAKAGILTEAQAAAISGHPYETGPAAGDWWQFFFEISQQADSILSNTANLIVIAETLKQIAVRAKQWQQRKSDEIERDYGVTIDHSGPHSLDLHLTLTLPDLVALCYADLVQRHGERGDVTISVYPRNRYAGFGSADHPGAGETYMIRIAAGEFSYFYLVDGGARISEHYRTQGDDVALLELPDLLPDDASGNLYRQPEHVRLFEVRSSVPPTELN